MATVASISPLVLPVAGGDIDAEPITNQFTNVLTLLNESGSLDEANMDLASADGIVGKSTAQTIAGIKTISGGLILQDNVNLTLGTGSDATLDFDGTNTVLATAAQLVITPTTDTIFSDGTGVVVGHTAQVSSGGVTPEFQVIGATQTDASMALEINSADVNAPIFRFVKSRNATPGSTTIVADGDGAGTIIAHVDDGTDYVSHVGSIQFVVDGTPGANDTPGRLVFAVTAAGAGTGTEQMRISEDGGITMSNLLAAAASTDVNINGSNELHSVTSSARFKDNPRTLETDTDRLAQLEVKTFEWKPGTGTPGQTDFGLIAEEVAAVMPELVNYRCDRRKKEVVTNGVTTYEYEEYGEVKPYSIRTQPLAILTLRRLQELEARVESLEV